MQSYSAGVIGVGFIGHKSEDSHLKAYGDCERTEIQTVCDLRLPASVGDRDDFAGFHDYRDMPHLDIVSICTPVETHAEIACHMAAYVKAIYLEKPIAPTLEEADIIIDVCKKYGTILQVNHQRMFYRPKIRWSRGLLNNGSHAFALKRQIGYDFEMEYVDTDEYIFEIDIASDPAPHRLVLKGVEHLVKHLDKGEDYCGSGNEAREVLKEVLEYERTRHNSGE